MKLSDAEIKISYNSYSDNIVDDFYVKFLSLATNYDRVSAYFSSEILTLYSVGIAEIYRNNGKIRFIFSEQISEKDYKLMKAGYENKKIIERQLHDKLQLDNNLNEIDLKRLSNLAFLIEKGIVEIKIAFTKKGVFHDKFGLIYNKKDCIYFRGSNNETVSAILHNYESFETSINWLGEERENQRIDNAINEFDLLWHNDREDLIVLPIPDIIREELIKYQDGSLHFEYDLLYENTLILDLNHNKQLTLRNNTTSNYDLTKNYNFKNFINHYVINNENDLFTFNVNINYLTMEKIMNHVSEICVKKDFNYYVSDQLSQFIKDKHLQIEKRKSLGIKIKNEDESLNEIFNEFKKIVDYNLERKLTNKQMWNAFHIVQMIKSANFSVPGAGKTSIVYGAFAYLNANYINKVNKIVMVGPINSFMSWKDEFFENFGNKKKLMVIDIQDPLMANTLIAKKQKLKLDGDDANLILINYESLKGLKDILNDIIDEKTLLVFDEAHKIKGIDGKTANHALDIGNNARYKVILTGTPLPNSYQDIYNLLKILFIDEYDSYFKYTPEHLRNPLPKLIEEINEKIYPFYCRITKSELQIPIPNDDVILKVEMTNQEKQLFKMLREKYQKNALVLYVRLMQAASNPSLLLKKIANKDIDVLFDSEDNDKNILKNDVDKLNNINFSHDEINIIKQVKESSKYKASIELVQKLVLENKYVLVWGIFIDTLKKIKKDLKKLNIHCEVIDGSLTQPERDEIISKYKKGEYQVLITNPHTLAESVSLHNICHDAVYFEFSFNLIHMIQSRDRINRLGLDANQYTQYYYPMLDNSDKSNNSIDEKIYQRLNEKKIIMLDLIEGKELKPTPINDFNGYDDIYDILK